MDYSSILLLGALTTRTARTKEQGRVLGDNTEMKQSSRWVKYAQPDYLHNPTKQTTYEKLT